MITKILINCLLESLSINESPNKYINHALKRHARAIVRNVMNSNNSNLYSLKNKQREEIEKDLIRKSIKLFSDIGYLEKEEQDLLVSTELTNDLLHKLQVM